MRHLKTHNKAFLDKATVDSDSRNGSHSETASNHKCLHCEARYKKEASLDDHIVKKHPEFISSVTRKIYKCAQCSYKTIKKNLNNHMAVHDPSYKLNSCSHCNATFKCKSSLNDHVLKKHPDFVGSLNRKILKCTNCNFKTTMKNRLVKHTSAVHAGIRIKPKLLKCIHCDAIVTSKVNLTDHVVRKHPAFIGSVTSRIYECTQCIYKTIKKHDFMKHLSTHTKTGSSSSSKACTLCPAKFSSDKWLDDHILRRHPDFVSTLTRQTYQCTICLYKTVFKYKFLRHKLVHPETASSYNLSTCIHCDAKLKSQAHLDEHVVKEHPKFITSLSKKVYECNECVYKTTIKRYFTSHTSRHT
ncbi:unnamed protein product [Callosobruchus maculatus]|uniref:C2H2-type domain-containing protein n=1 Tax=Callosobruchus maculatus TaxID=64391 RepID=A0A653BRS8_CALMS|nr:unnamed protein product [Callosobruchus maculatus]